MTSNNRVHARVPIVTGRHRKQAIMNEYIRRLDKIYSHIGESPMLPRVVKKMTKEHTENPHDFYLLVCHKYGVTPEAKFDGDLLVHGSSPRKQKKAVFPEHANVKVTGEVEKKVSDVPVEIDAIAEVAEELGIQVRRKTSTDSLFGSKVTKVFEKELAAESITDETSKKAEDYADQQVEIEVDEEEAEVNVPIEKPLESILVSEQRNTSYEEDVAERSVNDSKVEIILEKPVENENKEEPDEEQVVKPRQLSSVVILSKNEVERVGNPRELSSVVLLSKKDLESETLERSSSVAELDSYDVEYVNAHVGDIVETMVLTEETDDQETGFWVGACIMSIDMGKQIMNLNVLEPEKYGLPKIAMNVPYRYVRIPSEVITYSKSARDLLGSMYR